MVGGNHGGRQSWWVNMVIKQCKNYGLLLIIEWFTFTRTSFELHPYYGETMHLKLCRCNTSASVGAVSPQCGDG